METKLPAAATAVGVLLVLTVGACVSGGRGGEGVNVQPPLMQAPSPPAIAPGSASPGRVPANSPGPFYPNAALYTVNIGEGRFTPAALTIPPGSTVTWHNLTDVAHTVTADPTRACEPSSVLLPQGAQPFDSGEIAPNGTWSRQLTTPGTYRYFCRLHPREVIGTLEVTVRAVP